MTLGRTRNPSRFTVSVGAWFSSLNTINRALYYELWAGPKQAGDIPLSTHSLLWDKEQLRQGRYKKGTFEHRHLNSAIVMQPL